MELFYYKSSLYVFLSDFSDKTKTLKDYIVDVLDKISSTPYDVIYTRVTAFVIDNVDSRLPKLLIADYVYPSDDLYRYLPEHEEAAYSIVNKLKEQRSHLISPVVLLRILTNNHYEEDTVHHLFTDGHVIFLVGDNEGITSEIAVTDTYYYTIVFAKVVDGGGVITYNAGLANNSDLVNVLMNFFRQDNGDVDVVIFVRYI